MSMITTLLEYINKLKLSLSQWIILSLAAIIGGLVTAFKLQGKSLHKAQVDLLESQLVGRVRQDDKDVEDARSRYHEALDSYLSNVDPRK